jgi:hypothetical protein
VIGRYQVAYRVVQRQAANLPPNLLVVFNDLMLNLPADGTPKYDQRPRYVGFNIPVINPETSERGIGITVASSARIPVITLTRFSLRLYGAGGSLAVGRIGRHS